MECETSVRLHQQVLEAKIAVRENKMIEAQLEKAELLPTAEVNAYEHEHACVICCPLQPLSMALNDVTLDKIGSGIAGVSTGGSDARLEVVMKEQDQTNKQTNVDVRKWLSDISNHCPECGSSNLTTVNNERPLKHRCLDCLIFFAERDLMEKPRSHSAASGTA